MVSENFLYNSSHDACTGESSLKAHDEEIDGIYEAIPVIHSAVNNKAVEEIIGISNTMELLRTVDDEDLSKIKRKATNQRGNAKFH